MIAFVCVAFTYIFVSVVFYSCFPLQKNCIEDVSSRFSLSPLGHAALGECIGLLVIVLHADEFLMKWADVLK